MTLAPVGRRFGILVDRDGVLCNLVGPKLNRGPRDLSELDLRSGLDVFSSFTQKGFGLAVITNQPDISRGLLAREQEDLIKSKILQKLPGETRYFLCPHDEGDLCYCRKPYPGMLFRASRELNLDLGGTFVIGDTWRDMLAGQLAGCKTIFMRNTKYEMHSKENGLLKRLAPDFQIENLLELSDIIS